MIHLTLLVLLSRFNELSYYLIINLTGVAIGILSGKIL